MFKLQAETAQEYLGLQRAAPPGPWMVTPLGGGVSNTVLRVDTPGGGFVLKQALDRLRVQEEWLADPGRIRRECAALRELHPYLPGGSLPAVVFEDVDNRIFALEAAPVTAKDWKSLLFAKQTQTADAVMAGRILGALVDSVRHNSTLFDSFIDQTVFDQLRLDPYYRFTASRHPDLRAAFDEAIGLAQRRITLVHGDFSPKNFLIAGERMILIDFEVIHTGDPAFDAAFLLNHLLLKSHCGIDGCRGLAIEFWRTLGGKIDEQDTIRHLGCLHLARVDGKSPAEYLAETKRTQIREYARGLIAHPPKTVEEIFRVPK